MSIEETYDWAKQVGADFQVMAKRAEDVGALNKELTSGGDHPVSVVSFVQVDRPSFRGEVGVVEGDLFFHFFPAANEEHSELLGETDDGKYWGFKPIFQDALATSFLEVFKQEDKLCWDFVTEMHSWVVRCSGFGNNIMANELAEKLFNNLQNRLEK